MYVWETRIQRAANTQSMARLLNKAPLPQIIGGRMRQTVPKSASMVTQGLSVLLLAGANTLHQSKRQRPLRPFQKHALLGMPRALQPLPNVQLTFHPRVEVAASIAQPVVCGTILSPQLKQLLEWKKRVRRKYLLSKEGGAVRGTQDHCVPIVQKAIHGAESTERQGAHQPTHQPRV